MPLVSIFVMDGPVLLSNSLSLRTSEADTQLCSELYLTRAGNVIEMKESTMKSRKMMLLVLAGLCLISAACQKAANEEEELIPISEYNDRFHHTEDKDSD